MRRVVSASDLRLRDYARVFLSFVRKLRMRRITSDGFTLIECTCTYENVRIQFSTDFRTQYLILVLRTDSLYYSIHTRTYSIRVFSYSIHCSAGEDDVGDSENEFEYEYAGAAGCEPPRCILRRIDVARDTRALTLMKR